MPDCLFRPTRSTSFRAQVRGLIAQRAQCLICPKCGTGGSDAIAGQHSLKTRINKSNLIRKKGEYRAMSECSNYQLLHPTDYVRLREKYDHLYIYSHYIILHCPQRIISVLTAVVRQLLPAKQWLTETRRVLYYQFVV